MGNSIGTLSLGIEVDAANLTEGLANSTKELRLHRQAVMSAASPADEFAAAQRQLSRLMEINPQHADRYRAALANLERQYRQTQAAAMAATSAHQQEAMRLGGLSDAADKFAASLSPANLAIAGIATVTATATAAAYGFARELQSAIVRIDDTADAAANLGVAPEQFDRLRKAAYLADAPVEIVGTLLDKVQQKASEAASGEQAAADGFRQIGLDAKALKDLAPERQFELVARAIGGLNRGDQIRAMKDIFGKSAADAGNLIRNFDEINAQLEKMGVGLRPEAFDAIALADDATKRLTLSWQAFFDRLAVDVAPAVAAIVDELTATVQQTSDGVTQTSALRDVLYDVRDTVASVRDNWEEIAAFANATASFARMVTSPGANTRAGVDRGIGDDTATARARDLDRQLAEIRAREAGKKNADDAAMRRELVATQQKAAAPNGPDELERMLQQRRDELTLAERGKAEAEIEKAIRIGAKEEELALLESIRMAEERIALEKKQAAEQLDRERIHREAVLSLIDRAIAAEERLLSPQERLNRMIAEQAELVNEGLLDEAKATELVRREAAALKAETSGGVAAMTAGSQAFAAAVARRDGQAAQTELQRKAVEELKKLVRKEPVEIVVMKAGA